MGIVDFGAELGPLATCRASSEMSTKRSAKCRCGSHRAIRSPGKPRSGYLCHGEASERGTGTIAHTGAHYPKEDLRCDGPPNVYTRIGKSVFASHVPFCLPAARWYFGSAIRG
jgi:hypothetical protein